MGQTNPPFMSGVPELLLLRLLARREMYGYELVKAVRLVTEEAISLGEGVIYPVLHGLERGGALKAKRKAVGGRTRVYYSLTAKGKRRLARLEEDWQRIQFGVNAALGEARHA
ncbi:MAG: PadR family transcriptional regulator [Woeseiaceae bacterium]